NHELKFGFGYRSTPVESTTTWPGATNGYMRYRSSGYCAARGAAGTTACAFIAMIRDRQAAYDEKYNDLYVGDTILMGNLTLQAGLRWDRQKSRNTASVAAAQRVLGTPISLPCSPQLAAAYGPCAAGNVTLSLPQLTFPGDDRDLKWNTIA